MAKNIILVAGSPGAGKTTILRQVSGSFEAKIANMGTMMFDVASKLGYVTDRDQLRFLSLKKFNEVRNKALDEIEKMSGNIIIDTHASVGENGRYLPGFPVSFLEKLGHVRAATEAMVEEQIEALRKTHARLEPIDPPRPADKGDVLTIDFTLSVDGSELKDGGGEGVALELGSGQVLPELDAAAVGRSVEDAFEVSATFPAAHPRAELRGKSATFRVKVKDIKQRVLPAVDDEFAKDVGSFQTVVELRANVHTRLEKMLKDRADTILAEQIILRLNERNPLDVPPSLVEQQCRMMEMELLQEARRSGRQPTKDDFAKVHDHVHADAERKVRAGLLMAAIAKKHAIQVTDDDLRAGIEELAEESGKNVAKVRAEYSDPQRRNILIGMVLEDKVLTLIESKAVMKEGESPAALSSPENAPALVGEASTA